MGVETGGMVLDPQNPKVEGGRVVRESSLCREI